MGNYVLYGLFAIGLVIGAFLSISVGDVINFRNWDAVWIQAIGTISAVAVAIYVPWKIDNDKKQEEKRRNRELRKLSLKALGLEAWVMKHFFMNCMFAVDKKDADALQDLTGGTLSIDPQSPIVMEPTKYSVLSNLPDEVTTLYMNSVSRRFFAIAYMKAYQSDLADVGRPDNFFNADKAKDYCKEGVGCCNSILDKVRDEFGGLSFDLKIGDQSTD